MFRFLAQQALGASLAALMGVMAGAGGTTALFNSVQDERLATKVALAEEGGNLMPGSEPGVGSSGPGAPMGMPRVEPPRMEPPKMNPPPTMGDPIVGDPGMGSPGTPSQGYDGSGSPSYGGSMGEPRVDTSRIEPGMKPEDGARMGEPSMGGTGSGEGQPGQGQWQGSPGMNNGMNGEEQDKRMQEEQEKREKMDEERRKKMEAQSLARMKRDMKRMGKDIDRIKLNFDKYVKKGIPLPQDCSDEMQKVKELYSSIMSAETMDDLQDSNMEDFSGSFQVLNECRQRLEMLSRIPQMLKMADKQIKLIEAQWKRSKKGVAADLSEVVATGDEALQAIKDGRNKLQTLFKEGSLEEMEEVVQDGIFGRFDDIGAAINRLEAAKNAKRFVAQYTKRMQEAQRIIAKMKKVGEDTSDLEATLAQIKAKYNEIKGMKPGSEEYTDAVMELADLGQEFASNSGGTEDFTKYFGSQSGGPAGLGGQGGPGMGGPSGGPSAGTGPQY